MSENATNTNKEAQIEIGALWKKQGKSQKFLSGTLNLKALGFDKDVPVVVFSNKFKQKDVHPDLRVYLSKPKATATPTPTAKAVAKPSPLKAKSNPEPVEEAAGSDDDNII